MNDAKDDWYNQIKKSPLTPPSIVFQIVWPVLYMVMIISFIIYFASFQDPNVNVWLSLGMIFFITQFVLNLLWSPIFFYYHHIWLALIIIILMIVFVILTIIQFVKVNSISGFILVPYLIWLLFAFYLNLYICLNNK